MTDVDYIDNLTSAYSPHTGSSFASGANAAVGDIQQPGVSILLVCVCHSADNCLTYIHCETHTRTWFDLNIVHSHY